MPRQITREDYEKQKRQITFQVNKIIEPEVNEILAGIDESIKPFFVSLWNNRKKRAKSNGRLRDMTIFLILQMLGVKKINLDHKRVIAAGEFYNMASYYQNWHLDNKKSVNTDFDAKLCHLASHLYREKAHELINKTSFETQIKLALLSDLSESNKAIQKGQAFELAGARIIDQKNECFEKVLSNCLTRCKYMSGRFYGASFAMGPIMAKANKEDIDAFRQIGTEFGTGAQIINDVGDFCLVKSLVQLSEKDYQDQFADLVKGTMTLPIYELSKCIDLEKFYPKSLTQKEKEYLLLQLVQNKCFHSSRKESNKLMKSMSRNLKKFPKSMYRDMLGFQIGTLFQCNKFYVNLRENHDYIWGNHK
jgi:geranylgeranyl pyrophosphate synthase